MKINDVKYDWEEDIMQIDKENGEFLAFPAYYKDGSLEIRETPMTYITFDGVSALILGMYGYAYEEKMKEEIPVIKLTKNPDIAASLGEITKSQHSTAQS